MMQYFLNFQLHHILLFYSIYLGAQDLHLSLSFIIQAGFLIIFIFMTLLPSKRTHVDI